MISSRIIKDQTTGGSRSFGFVDMPDEAEARIAMKRINGRVVNGRNVSVTEARLTPAGKENFIRG